MCNGGREALRALNVFDLNHLDQLSTDLNRASKGLPFRKETVQQQSINNWDILSKKDNLKVDFDTDPPLYIVITCIIPLRCCTEHAHTNIDRITGTAAKGAICLAMCFSKQAIKSAQESGSAAHFRGMDKLFES